MTAPDLEALREQLVNVIVQSLLDLDPYWSQYLLADLHDGERSAWRERGTAVLDALLTARVPMDCPTCGRTGAVDCDRDDCDYDPGMCWLPCPAGCVDGRIDGPRVLAVLLAQDLVLLASASEMSAANQTEG